ncbi:MAG: Nramp family divalent metal transporter [Planctomycetota bacterium]
MSESKKDASTSRRIRFGPGWLVTAAFIGPGTVVTATKAGAEFGCQLLWTIVFAGFAAVVLQSLTARVGVLQKRGLGEAIRASLDGSLWLKPAVLLIVAAIGVGNTAYQTGNLTGAATGLTSVTPLGARIATLAIASFAVLLVWVGRYQVLHVTLVALVIVLSVAFLSTALLSPPSVERLATGAFVPRIPSGSLSVVLGLIGTTVVPYNLFLHASAAAKTWPDSKPDDQRDAIRESDRDTFLSVMIGASVTAAICVTAAVAFHDRNLPWTSISDTAEQLRPAFGSASTIAFGVGLFAAGLTSSITAPMATAFAIRGCLGRPYSDDTREDRVIAVAVIVVGAVLALSIGRSPAGVIVFAQVSNGLLLPIVAAFLLFAVARTKVPHARLGNFRFGIAVCIVLGVSCLGLYRLLLAILSL